MVATIIQKKLFKKNQKPKTKSKAILKKEKCVKRVWSKGWINYIKQKMKFRILFLTRWQWYNATAAATTAAPTTTALPPCCDGIVFGTFRFVLYHRRCRLVVAIVACGC